MGQSSGTGQDRSRDLSPGATSRGAKTNGVVVFVDGWNLHRGCERAFDHGQVHIMFLARHLAGDRPLLGVRYFIGVPDARTEADNARRRTRQLELMGRSGVELHPKKLRYRHEWKFDKWELPDPRKHEGETRKTTVTSRRQGREKGVDVQLALDAFQTAITGAASAIIIVSADTDLDLIPEQLDPLRADGLKVRVENAAVNNADRKYLNHAYDWTHQIDADLFAAVRDDFDYQNPVPRGARLRFLAAVEAGERTVPKDRWLPKPHQSSRRASRSDAPNKTPTAKKNRRRASGQSKTRRR